MPMEPSALLVELLGVPVMEPPLQLLPDFSESPGGRLSRRERGKRHAPDGHLFDDAGVGDLLREEDVREARGPLARFAME